MTIIHYCYHNINYTSTKNFLLLKTLYQTTMSLSCLQHVKRSEDTKRPPAPPLASFTGFTGDRSGSMSSMGGKQKEMTHKMIQQVQEDAKKSGVPTFFDFVTFDDTAEVHLNNVELNHAKLPSPEKIGNCMDPRGCTRYIDTALERLAAQNHAVTKYRDSLPRRVRALNPVIAQSYSFLTDGQDNSSNWTAKELFSAMRLYRKKGGKGIFLAANMDAVSVGGQFGFAPETSLTISAHDHEAIGSGLRSATQCLRQVSQGASESIAFTGVQRASSAGAGPAAAHVPINGATRLLRRNVGPPPGMSRGRNLYYQGLHRSNHGGH